MDTYTILCTAAGLFASVAILGLLMAGMRFGGIPRPPTWVAMIHGMLAVAGLTLLIFAAFTVGVPPLTKVAIGLFIATGIGGASIQQNFHAKLLPLSIPMIVIHATAAITSFVILIISIYGLPATI